MAITYTWAITELALTTVGSVQDYVVQSRWTCTSTDESLQTELNDLKNK